MMTVLDNDLVNTIQAERRAQAEKPTSRQLVAAKGAEAGGWDDTPDFSLGMGPQLNAQLGKTGACAVTDRPRQPQPP
jgi:hypothetical protein